jgi:hypothetical protein
VRDKIVAVLERVQKKTEEVVQQETPTVGRLQPFIAHSTISKTVNTVALVLGNSIRHRTKLSISSSSK